MNIEQAINDVASGMELPTTGSLDGDLENAAVGGLLQRTTDSDLNEVSIDDTQMMAAEIVTTIMRLAERASLNNDALYLLRIVTSFTAWVLDYEDLNGFIELAPGDMTKLTHAWCVTHVGEFKSQAN